MNLAAILGFCLLSLGPQSQGSASAPQPQGSQSQSSEAAQPSPSATTPSATGQTPNAPGQSNPPAKPRRHKKTTTPPDCSTAPTALNPAAGTPTDATSPAGAGTTTADPTSADSSNKSSAELKPCPPPKKVVRNGGTKEPAIQLLGGTDAEQAVHQRSTDELTAATGENLKKVEGSPLSTNQKEMVNQIKQFMEQSKKAVAAGDLERGHNLALKAHLLSDELVKP
jgi:hypothetical protein